MSKLGLFNLHKPQIFIPTLYFIEGLPYTIINATSTVFFKSLGAGNEFIGLTSLLALPWTLKFLWAPLVDTIASKKKWIIVTQIAIAILLSVFAFSTSAQEPVHMAAALFGLLAIVAATQDIAIDGYYLEILDAKQQAFYVGIRNTFYRLAMLFGTGLLVYTAGTLAKIWTIQIAWDYVFAVSALLVGLAACFHFFALPQDRRISTPVLADRSRAHGLSINAFREVFLSYLDQPRIVAILIYILSFRLGDALMLKMAQPFLLDSRSCGGLGLSISDVGLIYGTVGTVSLLAAGIAGSFLIARDGLKRWLLPFALIQNLAIPMYWLLSVVKPGPPMVAVVNAIEQAAYGLGVTAFTVFILGTVKPGHKAAHYAIATALMAAGMLIPSACSGFLQAKLGYATFFLLSSLASIPGVIIIFFLPTMRKDDEATL